MECPEEYFLKGIRQERNYVIVNFVLSGGFGWRGRLSYVLEPVQCGEWQGLMFSCRCTFRYMNEELVECVVANSECRISTKLGQTLGKNASYMLWVSCQPRRVSRLIPELYG